jgi:hypothetical protein
MQFRRINKRIGDHANICNLIIRIFFQLPQICSDFLSCIFKCNIANNMNLVFPELFSLKILDYFFIADIMCIENYLIRFSGYEFPCEECEIPLFILPDSIL